MFQSKIFSYKFNSLHDEERREGVLGFKITSIQEEKGEEEPSTPRMETRRKFGRVDSAPLINGDLFGLPQAEGGGEDKAPFERQDSEVSTLSTFSEVDLDEFYVEENPPGPSRQDEDPVSFGIEKIFNSPRRRLSFEEDLDDVSFAKFYGRNISCST